MLLNYYYYYYYNYNYHYYYYYYYINKIGYHIFISLKKIKNKNRIF